MKIPQQMATDSFIQVDRISPYRSQPGLPWQKTLPVNAILEVFSLTLSQHERLGLLGCSGCGKSTLLKVILALDPVGFRCGAIDGHHDDPRRSGESQRLRQIAVFLKECGMVARSQGGEPRF